MTHMDTYQFYIQFILSLTLVFHNKINLEFDSIMPANRLNILFPVWLVDIMVPS